MKVLYAYIYVFVYVMYTSANSQLLYVCMFTNGLGDWVSIPGWVILKTQKIILETSLLDTKHYKVFIKGKVEQSRQRSSVLSYTSV